MASKDTLFEIPEDCKFLETHEYAIIDDDRALIGISHYAAEQLGDIVYVELPEVGQSLEKGDTFGSIESVKAASDLYMPLSGEILAINTQLQEEPGQVNDAPYKGGWMIEVSIDNAAEMDELLERKSYVSFLDDNG